MRCLRIGGRPVLVDADSGTVEARYEYGPFGESLRASGNTIAGKNPFRFSTKYVDSENGFAYYGFRYYSPETGRWFNRDPLEESGDVNIAVFGNNDSINHVDPYGQKLCFKKRIDFSPGNINFKSWKIETKLKLSSRGSVTVCNDGGFVTFNGEFVGTLSGKLPINPVISIVAAGEVHGKANGAWCGDKLIRQEGELELVRWFGLALGVS